MRSRRPEFELVTDEEGFRALEPEWDGLWARTAARRFTQAFAWRWLGWLTTGRPRGRRLAILVMRLGGEAVLIWPMTVRRRLLLWRVATALGPEYTDYDPVLVAAGPDAVGHMQAACAFLRRRPIADFVNLRFARHGETSHAAVSGGPVRRVIESLPAPHVALAEFETWDAYWRTRRRHIRTELDRRARRLGELGQVTFALVEDEAEFDDALSWTVSRKLDWMERTGHDNDFLATPEFHAFLAAIGKSRQPEGRWLTFVLRLDGGIVATKMGAIDGHRFEDFISAQDIDFARFSVGSIILARTMQWLFDRGVDYDFRVGEEPYKLDWATGQSTASTYRLLVTPWGGVGLALIRGLAAMRRRPFAPARPPPTSSLDKRPP